jgi:glycosyltransferase involved in cell wall biosynthesis
VAQGSESVELPIAPLVSIVIVVFRDRAELAALLESIDDRWARDCELIVIDGASDDGSVELLREMNHKIDYWVSERDRGIYDAMNKGIAAASGEYIWHLNAGDRPLLLPCDTLRTCLQEGIDVACFRVRTGETRFFQPKTGFRALIANPWHHQGTFYRRSSHPGYDADYRVYGDFDVNQRMRKAGRSVKLFDEVVALHTEGGGSTITGGSPHAAEIWRTVRKNSGALYVPVAFVWLHM